MASGIPVSPEITQAYADVSKRRSWAVVFKLEKNAMVIDKTFPGEGSTDPAADWEKVLSVLKEGGCRYVIADFKQKETELVMKSKVLLLSYVSDEAKVMEKMLYSSTFVQLINELDAQKTVQANDLDEVSYATLKKSIFHS